MPGSRSSLSGGGRRKELQGAGEGLETPFCRELFLFVLTIPYREGQERDTGRHGVVGGV